MISLAFLLFTGLFLLSVAVLARPSLLFAYFDLPSFLFILLGVTGYFLLFGRKEFGRGVKTFFAFSYPPTEENVATGQFFLRLSKFIRIWGSLGAFIGIALMLSSLDPDTIGPGVAISLLCPFYALGLALFVFLPIGLRLSPPTVPSQLLEVWHESIRQLLLGLGIFCLLSYLIVVFSDLGHFPPTFGFESIFLFIDIPSLILIVGSWWLFRLASGKRQKWIAAPTIIAIGLFWSIMGLVAVLSNLDPDTLGPGVAVSMITVLYAFITAIGFLVADMVSENRSGGIPSSLDDAEKTEQVKEILDRAVENERR
jgi:hypothetical protein